MKKFSKMCPLYTAYYMIVDFINHLVKFVSDLQHFGGFLWFPPPIKLTATI
jgi:hypothetical protein